MTIAFQTDGLTVRFAQHATDRAACARLRAQCFGPGEADGFEPLYRQLMIEEAGRLRATLRLRLLSSGAEMAQGYAAQFHRSSGLEADPRRMLEVGRFALDAPGREAGLLRLTWAALTGLVEAERIALLYGCASLPGADPARHHRSLARLAARHLGPPALRPRPQVEGAIRFAALPPPAPGQAPLPPLLQGYLSLGGWTGDYAIRDERLDTLHVFTALEVGAVPPPRAQSLRRLAGTLPLAWPRAGE